MPRKRKSEDEQIATSTVAPSSEGYEKGGRVLRARETCMCPVCGMYYSPAEIQAHAQACLYFLEQTEGTGGGGNEVKKKTKKGISSSVDSTTTSTEKSPMKSTTSNLSSSDSAVNDSPSKSPKKPKPVHTEWKPNTVASWNIPYAPVYRPTLAEFKSPLEYISKIRPTAEKYGICVIVPPYPAESWTKHIGDPKTFTFRTKVQNIHQLKTRWQGRNEIFVSNLASFLEKRGEPLRAVPKVEGRDLDLYKLFTSVVNKGGYQVVERANIWKNVADDLRLSIACVRNNSLRNNYHKYLFAYEMHRKSKLQFRPANTTTTTTTTTTSAGTSNEQPKEDDDLYIAQDITDDLYNTDYLEEENAEDEFGFYEGEEYTLANFEKKARGFSDKWFPAKPTPEQVEEEFWRIVETAEDSVKVDYGSDLDVTKMGRSGFSRDQCVPGHEFGPYITEDHSHWNLNHLPRMRGSVLSHINETVSGVTDPMLYVGMLFSSFCWHTEDNYLYSINYMHKGTAKTWYGIPAHAAEQFEEVMKSAVPDLFVKHPDLLHLLITMIAPSVLVANNVPIVRAVQEPGQYVITFPKAYHAGFSHGFTCAEAVNFAPADWLPYGHESVLHYRTIKRQSVFSHEELVCTIAQRAPPPETAYWVAKELQKIREREQSSRDLIRLAGYFCEVAKKEKEPKEQVKQCKVCGYDCFLSYVRCECSPHQVACLLHHDELCQSCSTSKKFLKILVPIEELDDLTHKTESILNQSRNRNIIDLTDDDDTPQPVPSNYSVLQPPLSKPPTIPPAPATASTSTTTTTAPTPMEVESTTTTTQSTSAPSTSKNVNETPADKNPAPVNANVNGSPVQNPASPTTTTTTDKPKFGIVINLTNQDKKKKAPPNPYENKIPPPPTIRTPSGPMTSVSSFTAHAAKQHASYSSSYSQSPSPTPPSPVPSYRSHSPSVTSSSRPSTPSTSPGPSKLYTFHNYAYGPSDSEMLPQAGPNGTPPRERLTPTNTPSRSTPPSPLLSDHMNGIALTSSFGKTTPVHLPKPKPVHIIIDGSPMKA